MPVFTPDLPNSRCQLGFLFPSSGVHWIYFQTFKAAICRITDYKYLYEASFLPLERYKGFLRM